MDTIYNYQSLYEFTYTVFKHIECDNNDASTATKTLLAADVRGIDSHGVARLSGYVAFMGSRKDH